MIGGGGGGKASNQVPLAQPTKTQVRVSKKQESNPLLRLSKFQYVLVDDAQMPEDYEVNDRVSVLFLSLKYHIAYPLYIVGRLEELYKMRRNKNRILLVLADH
jgi:hypothetical protein